MSILKDVMKDYLLIDGYDELRTDEIVNEYISTHKLPVMTCRNCKHFLYDCSTGTSECLRYDDMLSLVITV